MSRKKDILSAYTGTTPAKESTKPAETPMKASMKPAETSADVERYPATFDEVLELNPELAARFNSDPSILKLYKETWVINPAYVVKQLHRYGEDVKLPAG